MFRRSLMLVGLLSALAALAVGIVVLRGESYLNGDAGGGDERGESESANLHDHADNLLAKERVGKWTRGEGLVATLRLFLGQVQAEEVVGSAEIDGHSGTGIIEMAQDYVAGGDDPALQAEVEQLLDRYVFDAAELEEMAGLNVGAALPRGVSARLNFESTLCADFFEGYAPWAEATPCVLVQTVNAGGKVHRIWRPVDGIFEHPWTEKHYALAEAAILETVPQYSQYGEMPPLNVVFYVTEADGVAAEAAGHKGSQCGIGIHTSMQDYPDMKFKMDLAHEMSHCFQEENFDQPDYATRRWREEGLADYMPNLPYPAGNAEWEHIWALRSTEYNNTLFERAYDNFIWFQFLKNEFGVAGMLDVVRHVGPGDQAAQLATFPGIALTFGKFHRQFADALIMDDSGVPIPTQYHAPQREIAGPQPTVVKEGVPQFGVRRVLIVVPDPLQATITVGTQGNEVEVGPLARPLSAKGNWGDVPYTVPVGDGCEGERAYLVSVTSVEPGYTWELGAPSVQAKDGDDCEPTDEATVTGRDACLIGTWHQDLDVLTAYVMDMDPPDFETTPYTGLQRITFYGNGFVTQEWEAYKSGYKQHMTDARDRPMNIGAESTFQGWSLSTWAANGIVLQYSAGDAAVAMRTKSWLQDNVNDTGWKDVSSWFGGSQEAKADSPVGAGSAVSPAAVGRPISYKCLGNRLEIQHRSMPWTLVWHRQ